jgi:hypothetical protein
VQSPEIVSGGCFFGSGDISSQLLQAMPVLTHTNLDEFTRQHSYKEGLRSRQEP